MLKQLKDLTGLLLVPIFTSFQKRQLCSPNNINFLFSRLVNLLLINLEISRLSIPKACFLEKEKKVLMLLPNHRVTFSIPAVKTRAGQLCLTRHGF